MGPPCLKFGQPFQHLPHSLLKASLVLYVLRIFVLQNSNIFHMYGGPLFRPVSLTSLKTSGKPYVPFPVEDIDLLGRTDF